MCLAVLVHAIGERTHAPIFRLRDLAARLFDDAGHLGGQFFNLLGARVLTREKNMLVERHGCPFLCWRGSSAASPSNPSEKTRDKLKKAGTRDDGPIGPATSKHQKGEIAETVRSAPGRGPTDGRVIRILSVLASKSL